MDTMATTMARLFGKAKKRCPAMINPLFHYGNHFGTASLNKEVLNTPVYDSPSRSLLLDSVIGQQECHTELPTEKTDVFRLRVLISSKFIE